MVGKSKEGELKNLFSVGDQKTPDAPGYEKLKATAMVDWQGDKLGIELISGEQLFILRQLDPFWYRVRNSKGVEGICPVEGLRRQDSMDLPGSYHDGRSGLRLISARNLPTPDGSISNPFYYVENSNIVRHGILESALGKLERPNANNDRLRPSLFAILKAFLSFGRSIQGPIRIAYVWVKNFVANVL